MRRQPVLWIFALVALGVALGGVLVPSPLWLALVWVVALVLLARASRTGRGVALASLLVVLAAATWRGAEASSPEAAPPASCGTDVGRFLVHVDAPVERSHRRGGVDQRTTVRLEAERCADRWQPRDGRVGVRLRGGSPVARGDVLELSLRVRLAAPALNPVGPDLVALARQRHVIGWAEVRGVHLVRERGSGLLARLDRGRSRVALVLERALGSEAAALAKALALGDRGDITPERRLRWADAGIAHLLAISGLHIGIVAALLYGLMRLLVMLLPGAGERFSSRRLAAGLTLVPLAGFCLWVGAPPSAVRATVMAGAVLFGLALGRPAAVPNALGVAGAAILLVAPTSLEDPGFLLSFAAVGMLLALPRMGWPRGRVARWIVGSLVASTAASLATAPISLYFFGRLSLIAPLVNLVAVPIATLVVTPLTLVYAPLALAFPSLAAPLSRPLELGLGSLEALGSAAARVPNAALAMAPLGLTSLVAFIVALVAALLWPRWRPARWILLGATMVFAASLSVDLTARSRSDELVVLHPYVGQGDATLVLFPGGQVMLVDAGGAMDGEGWDPGEQVLAPLLVRLGIRTIDLAVLTHPHPDHVNGFTFLSHRFGIRELWHNGAGGGLPAVRALLDSVRSQGGSVRAVGALPSSVSIGGVRLEVLHPAASEAERLAASSGEGGNDDSLVLRLRYGARSLLLSGDIEKESEAILAPHLGAADILKAPHHGSSTSSSRVLLEALRPGLVVVSCGENNRYGFPHAEVLERYRAVGARVLRTDHDGLITLRTRGASWQVSTYRSGLAFELGAAESN